MCVAKKGPADWFGVQKKTISCVVYIHNKYKRIIIINLSTDLVVSIQNKNKVKGKGVKTICGSSLNVFQLFLGYACR